MKTPACQKRTLILIFFLLVSLSGGCATPDGASAVEPKEDGTERPNILFAFADDWGAHASAYGTSPVETPAFDRVAREGVLFERAFAPAPSCTPSRGSVLSGQHAWRLGPGANLYGTLLSSIPVYTRLLQKQADYFVGYTRKGWGPGEYRGNRMDNPAGTSFANFKAFLEDRPEDQPFCFWFGSNDPHRGYSDKLRERYDIDPAEVDVPPYLPDVEAVRKDIANYLAEVLRFDRDLQRLLRVLRERGELDDTMVVVSGDHGWPFPRGKTHLYDSGSRVPLAVRWPEQLEEKQKVSRPVNLADLAPTFLDVAGVKRPEQMTARSLLPLMKKDEEVEHREHWRQVFLARERHVLSQEAPQTGGYPMRAIRTEDYLYIRNVKPKRWPSGTPHWQQATMKNAWLADTDNGPTKYYMWAHRDEPGVKRKYDLAFGKRPAEELYYMPDDPYQMKNLAEDPEHAEIKQKLRSRLMEELKRTDDPRVTEGGTDFDQMDYSGGVPTWPGEEVISRYK